MERWNRIQERKQASQNLTRRSEMVIWSSKKEKQFCEMNIYGIGEGRGARNKKQAKFQERKKIETFGNGR